MATQAAATATDQQAGSIVATMRGFASLPARARLGLIVGAAALVAILIASLAWMRAPEYRVLFSNLNDRDGGAIVAALGQMNVPYKFVESSGAILIPAGQVHDTRLRLASQGLPKGGNVGFELLENQRFGITQFQEQVNYQRALEGELARSIQSLSAVASARVHLAIPKPSVFLRETQKPTASVVLTLQPRMGLDRGQIAGIVHLVASSVPDLQLNSVSVLDQSGALLSGNGAEQDSRLDPTQIAYVHQIEASHIKRINDILEPVLGRNNFRAQVTADVDFNVTEYTDEQYKPNRSQQAASIRSEQWNESSSALGGNGPQGVPGALSNQPPVAASAPINNAQTPPGPPGSGGPDTAVKNPLASQRSTSVNYEVDKTVRHTRAQVGAVRRLSTAVVVNYRKPAEAGAAPEALGREEIARIEALVREAIGFKQERGDSLQVSAVPFSGEPEAAVVALPFWQRPEVIAHGVEVAKWLLAMFVLFIALFGVIRPVLRQLAAPPPASSAGSEGASPDATGAAAGNANQDGASGATNVSTNSAGLVVGEDGSIVALSGNTPGAQPQLAAPEKSPLELARELAKQDPKLVATIVRGWVNGNG